MKTLFSIFLSLILLSPLSQSINITSPNGGESYVGTSTETVTWSTTGFVGLLDLYYSTNSGTSWTLYDNNINPSAGSYIWTVPFVNSAQCLVKLDDGTVQDESDAVFNIYPANGSITLTSPNGGEVYTGASSQAINWSTFGPVASLSIYYSLDAGANWVLYASGVSPFSGSTSWNVPNVSSTQCLVRITDNISVSESNNFFTINALSVGTLNITAPNGGESFVPGTTTNISWTTSGSSSVVDLSYSIDNGVNWALIASGIASSPYTWTIPGAPSSSCLVKAFDGTLTDASDAVFAIQPNVATISLINPNGGEILNGFDNYVVQWDTVGNSHIDSVYFYFQESTTFDAGLLVENSGEYNWSVPNVSTNTARVKVQLQNTAALDVSDADFTINPIGITLLTPNGGELLQGADVYSVTWDTIGNSQVDSVLLYYSETSTFGASFITVLNNGSYDWDVPNVNTSSALMMIELKGTSISDTSDAVFSISPIAINLANPVGGEILTGGTDYQINWTQTGTYSGVDIDYSFDNGATFNSLATNVTDTFYVWTLPNIDTINCLVSITYQNIVSDTSATVFAIEFSDVSNAEIGLFDELMVYPNPTKDLIYFSESLPIQSYVQLIDIMGKLLYDSGNVNFVDVSKLESGVYFILVNSNSQVKTLRFSKY